MSVSIEGFTLAELEELPLDQLDAFVRDDAPLVLRVGTSEVLLQIRRTPTRLTVELAHVDGGGEGVLPTLAKVFLAYARRLGVEEVEWLVHATRCAVPNHALRAVLERRGFARASTSGGEVLRRLQAVDRT